MNPYDEVPYNNCAILHTHPNRLAVMASLLGLKPAPAERCRVLELGCGNGANLIPMAHAFPESRFFGIDLAAQPIAKGQAMIRDLGLQNIGLQQMDILDFPRDAGEFDYIIAHGIYSWVPELVRDKILAISKAHLAAHGVAFVSYNTYPGWRIRQMMREMMQYHVVAFSDPREKIQQARALAKFLSESADQETSSGRLLADEMRDVLRRPGVGLYHDDLSPVNDPIYFVEFAAHAARHGLQFLVETQFTLGKDFNAPAEMLKTLERISTDVVQREQYLDFLECRRFRETLLCHQNLSVSRDINLELLKSLKYVSFSSLGSSQPELDSGKAVKFVGGRGASIWTAHPVAKAALQHLSENWPASFTLEEIGSAALQRLSAAGVTPNSTEEGTEQELSQLLLTAYGAGLVEALFKPPHFVLQVSDRPVSSPVARVQLRYGEVVASLLHTTFDVSDPLAKQLILLLDGSRDRVAILNELRPIIESGAATLNGGKSLPKDPAEPVELFARELDEALKNLARVPLLVG
jgi:methyltransferase-like protein/2-polyprenyl-3-methyl-5-hydroxy-6-metoxy-1,4-benzoquinol methylase